MHSVPAWPTTTKYIKKMKISHLCDFVEIVIYACSFVIIIRQ